jgi:hypothetical protein
VAEVVQISADVKQHVGRLHEYAEQGFDEIYLHHVGQHQRPFIEAFAGSLG